MTVGILSHKIGMTQLFDDGNAIGVTVVMAEPSTVVRIRRKETDGYDALQLGYQEVVQERKITRPMLGHFKKAGVVPHKHLFEVRMDDTAAYKVGDKIGVEAFAKGDRVDVTGTSRGLGFQGVVKRWNFAGGPKSHGSHFHRRPGSVGNCVNPGRVVKGKKLPGHMGNCRRTTKGVEILRVDAEKNLLVLRGAVPGPRGGMLKLTRKGDG
jgi:large subunit ribosomal protein L3